MTDRMRILWLIRYDGPLSPGEISLETKLDMAAVYANLATLAREGLVARKADQWMVWDVTLIGRRACPAAVLKEVEAVAEEEPKWGKIVTRYYKWKEGWK
jgi:DNA-binding MarR family transcriptional regulator